MIRIDWPRIVWAIGCIVLVALLVARLWGE